MERSYGTEDKVAKPLLDGAALIRQASSFRETMLTVLPMVKLRDAQAMATAEADKSMPAPVALVTMLWQQIGTSPALYGQWPEYVKVVQISLVLVGGGVEDERTFSTLTFVKNNLCSCLGEPHLNVCLRLFCSRDDYTLASFPYRRAFVHWKALCTRRAVAGTGAGRSGTSTSD